MALIQGDLSQEEFKSLQKAVRYVMEGVKDDREEKFKLALRIFESLDESKSPLEIFKGRGICYHDTGDLKSARQNYRKGLRESKKANNEEFTRFFWQSRVDIITTELCQKNKISQVVRVIKILKGAVEKDPFNPEFHRLLYNIYAEQKEWDLDLEELDRYIELEKNPKRKASAFLRKGFVLEEKGGLIEAEKAYLETINLNPGNPRAYACLGFIYLERNEKEKAYQELQKAEKIGFQNPNLLYILIDLSFSLEKYEEGREYLRKIIEVDSRQVKEILEVAPSKEACQIIFDEIFQKREPRLEESFLSTLGEGKINIDWAKEILIEREAQQADFIQRQIRKKKKVRQKDFLRLEMIKRGLERIKEEERKAEEEIIQKFEAKGWAVKQDKRF